MKNNIQYLGFYLIDEKSKNYFVGKIYRTVKELKKEILDLNIGDMYFTGNNTGFVRFQ
tara:strand:- start:214 stop:387 length:174 start_codon:yes stop_codon:yes gene_type:complete